MESDMTVKVRVPASSANLGPGFDCMGVALNLYTEISLSIINDGLIIEVSGEGHKEIEKDEENLVYKAVSKIFQKAQVPLKGLKIQIKNGIPLKSGLGSSAAAIIGGMMGANELLGGFFTKDEILNIAAVMEGHADNVGPALNGGLNITAVDGDYAYYVKKELDNNLHFIAFTPQKGLKTEIARNILPEKIDFKDGVFNTGRASLLTAAFLTQNYELLKVASLDRLHQQYRSALIPEMYQCFDKAMSAGAYSAFLSGAGPTIMALSCIDKDDEIINEVGNVYVSKNIPYRVYKLYCENKGTQILKTPLIK
ncbi:MAG: homoserine kinase [Minisyncoccia bacterium]